VNGDTPKEAPGELEDLRIQDPEALRVLLEEEREVLWRTLHWETVPMEGTEMGLAWTCRGRLLGYVTLRASEATILLSRLFASRLGPAEAVEWALLQGAAHVAFSIPGIIRLSGEVLSAREATLARLLENRPAEVRSRALMEVDWKGPGPGKDMGLEPWRGEDLPSASALLLRAYEDKPSFLPDPSHRTPEGVAFLLEQSMAQPLCGRFEPGASFVARHGDGTLAGFILATRMGPATGNISEVAVDPSGRRHGLGRALAIRSLEALRALGCTSTHLAVDLDNLPALGLYQGLGFRIYHRFPELRLTPGDLG
jgi:ribosomal protein S18 acetylase RimI-like enzyme